MISIKIEVYPATLKRCYLVVAVPGYLAAVVPGYIVAVVLLPGGSSLGYLAAVVLCYIVAVVLHLVAVVPAKVYISTGIPTRVVGTCFCGEAREADSNLPI